LSAELLEDRVTPAVLSPYEVSALSVINQMRANPAAFATDLRQLYQGGSYTSPTGYAANDPIWTDLRSQINDSEATSSWRSGFNSSGSNTFLSVASALPARAPLAWDAAMQDGAAGHDQWMYANVYAHSVFVQGQAPSTGETPSNPIPGIARNFSVATGDYFNYTGLGLYSAGENISYGYNIGGATFQAYRNGQITLDGYYQRLVYADVIGFMMEFNNGGSSPFGHLENLSGNFNVTGISNDFYENPVEGTPDGVAESYFATQRFGSRSNTSYANVIAYLDANNNNVYDAGEGLAAQVNFNFGAGSLVLPNSGYGAVQLPSSGSYTVSAAYQGNALGSQSLVANGSNRTLTFRVTSLVDATPPVSQLTHLPAYQTSSNFIVQWSGTDAGGSGIVSYDVYAAVDGGSFVLWQAATTQTQATYAGTLGHRYAFYSTAIDGSGNRQATPSGAQAATELRAFDVATPSNIVGIAAMLSRSPESYTIFVRQAYQTYLGRAADSGGLATWVDQMSRGLISDEQLEANLLSSPEYIASHGGGGTAWIVSIYQNLLGRSPTSGDVAGWISILNSGASRYAVALGFTSGIERESIRVRQNYQTFLGRTPSASEVASWVDQFVNHGMSSETMIAEFVGSREFFNSSSRGASTYSTWIGQAYLAILQRPASTSDIAYWLPTLNVPANLGTYAVSVTHSDESYRVFITQAYVTYLGRSPDTAGLNTWLDLMKRGVLTDEQLEAQFISSPEYIRNHGGAGSGWVAGMYVDLLHRNAAPSEVAGWVYQMNHGASTYAIALGFAASTERESLRVRQNYLTLLGRAPAQSEVDSWVDQFVNRGMTNETMTALFVASPEYFRKISKGNGNIIQWLDGVFNDIYHRPITLSELLAIAATIQ